MKRQLNPAPPPPVSAQDLLDTKQAAAFLGLRPKTLEIWRHLGKGPRYYKYSARMVRYRVADLAEWLEQQRIETAVA